MHYVERDVCPVIPYRLRLTLCLVNIPTTNPSIKLSLVELRDITGHVTSALTVQPRGFLDHELDL